MGSCLFAEQSRHLLAPANAVAAAGAAAVVVPHVLVVLGDHCRVAVFAVDIVLDDDGQRQTRLALRILLGVAQAQPEDRIDTLRQLQQVGHLAGVVADAADVADAQAGRFSGRHHVLCHQGGVHSGNDEVLGEVTGKGFFILLTGSGSALQISTEDQKFCGTFHVGLLASPQGQFLPALRVPDADHGGALQEARSCR